MVMFISNKTQTCGMSYPTGSIYRDHIQTGMCMVARKRDNFKTATIITERTLQLCQQFSSKWARSLVRVMYKAKCTEERCVLGHGYTVIVDKGNCSFRSHLPQIVYDTRYQSGDREVNTVENKKITSVDCKATLTQSVTPSGIYHQYTCHLGISYRPYKYLDQTFTKSPDVANIKMES
ncbi:hypothetical protein CBL_00016 [Carabus blaptoides fortunei]